MRNLIRTALNALFRGVSTGSDDDRRNDATVTTGSVVPANNRTDEAIIPIYDRQGRPCGWLGEHDGHFGANIYSLDGSFAAVSVHDFVWRDRRGHTGWDFAGWYAGGLFLDIQEDVVGFIEETHRPADWQFRVARFLRCQPYGGGGRRGWPDQPDLKWEENLHRTIAELEFPPTQAPPPRPALPERRGLCMAWPLPPLIDRPEHPLRWSNDGWLERAIPPS